MVKHHQLLEFIEKPRLDHWQISEDPVSPWMKIFVSVYKKKDLKVVPLPRIRPNATNDDTPLLFPQLMQYISQSNLKNLWKEAYKKYGISSDSSKETHVSVRFYWSITLLLTKSIH